MFDATLAAGVRQHQRARARWPLDWLNSLEGAAVSRARTRRSPEPGRPWSDAPLPDLISHVVAAHQEHARRKLPELLKLAGEVRAKHGADQPLLHRVEELLSELADLVERHFKAEEQVLLPWIEELAHSPPAGDACLDQPLATMHAEHCELMQALRRLRTLTGDYHKPHGACYVYRNFLARLAELDRELSRVIETEETVLFARATTLAHCGSAN